MHNIEEYDGEEIEYLMREVDKNGDGQITFDEIAKLFDIKCSETHSEQPLQENSQSFSNDIKKPTNLSAQFDTSSQQPLLDQSEQNYGDQIPESLPSISDTSETHSAITDFEEEEKEAGVTCESIREQFFKP
jgi:hypothetical protein